MILVTGGAGYIGSHTNKLLCQRGFKTVVLDNLVYGHKEHIVDGIFIEGDLSDQTCLDALFSRYDIEGVIHFAAYAYVGESVKEPAKYYRNNVVNTLNLLDAMIKHQVSYIVFSSTCATYGISDTIPITENCPQYPINPYGASKLMIERILSDFATAYPLKYCALRYFNAAGDDPEGKIGEKHDPETHIIPIIFETLQGKRQEVPVFGNDYPTADGTAIRDYVHVCDLADAHIRALEYLKNGGKSDCFNLSANSGTSVAELIKIAEKVSQRKIPFTYYARRAGDPAILIGSAEKAKKILGWDPVYSDIETIVQHAWQWHKKENQGNKKQCSTK